MGLQITIKIVHIAPLRSLILQVTESTSLYVKDVFLSCDPTLCSGRGAGDYLLLEQAWAWTASSLYICVRVHVGVRVCACVRGRRARDARIKKRLVEIKALP